MSLQLENLAGTAVNSGDSHRELAKILQIFFAIPTIPPKIEKEEMGFFHNLLKIMKATIPSRQRTSADLGFSAGRTSRQNAIRNYALDQA